MEDSKTYKTRDFYSSVILKTLGIPLIRLDRDSGHFVTFVFSDSEEKAESLLQDYWNRKTTVVARDLVETINELKTRIYER